MTARDEPASDQRELIELLMITVFSLIAGFAIGLTCGYIYHLPRLTLFMLSFGLSFAIFLLLFCARAAAARLRR
ncbi:hypothetical protein [Methanocella sp. MCL-LM]|uniref:hypothetical protein n=1 Tax=Methanocella sp. MCL-LM TaxID=3412035 RepID=UPI003C72D10F